MLDEHNKILNLTRTRRFNWCMNAIEPESSKKLFTQTTLVTCLLNITMQFPDSTSQNGEVAHLEDTRHVLYQSSVDSKLSLSVSLHMHECLINFISYLLSLRDPHKCD